MNTWFLTMALFLLLNLFAGLLRVFRGPTHADRMLSVELFGTTTVAMLLLLAFAMELPALLDVAMVLVLLATVATVAFVRGTGKLFK
ncbi:monovalent cation/H+ antiporter complex subunit F [Desulfurispira natronophila]|uniref:Multicomponent Na+:H+ antiporter subunit F n=1 Tax=Desulfurispira natronophila TaxID=682562 RepID=A0A7W7Y4W8_9BACT|nr:monovalent cation/H+ antiporter complex subunit F [Desulfurispira natronophila]MBB5022069.1 multicomponent Na+:H+ antiporter subunit F [Desulfurispira natronophila]